MNKFWIFASVLVILTVALSACGGGEASGGGGIQLPGMEGGEGGEGGAAGGNTLIYVLIGAIVLVAVVALVGKR